MASKHGKCILHPRTNLEVVESEGKYYFLDSYEVLNWELNAEVKFVAEKSHAFDLIKSRTKKSRG